MSEIPVGEVVESTATRGQVVTVLGKDGVATPSGASAATAGYVQGANFAAASPLMTFGDPAASPAHDDPFSGNVNAAAAQGEKIAIAAPATGKFWQTLQVALRWTSAPAAPVVGTPDMFLVIYWETAEGWNEIRWPAKYLDDSSAVDDMRNFSNFTSFDFPIGATAFAIGVAGYVDGELYADLRAKG